MKTNQLIVTVLGSLCLASHAFSGQIEQQDINEIRPGITTDLAYRFGLNGGLDRPRAAVPPGKCPSSAGNPLDDRDFQ